MDAADRTLPSRLYPDARVRSDTGRRAESPFWWACVYVFESGADGFDGQKVSRFAQSESEAVRLAVEAWNEINRPGGPSE